MSWFDRIFGKSRSVPARDLSPKHPGERRKASGVMDIETATRSKQPLRRQSDRALKREMLHNLVREAMLGMGVLSSQFKFKVLSVDPQGSQFFVMVDLSDDVSQDLTDLAAMEIAIIHRAVTLRKLNIKSVYWRMTEKALVQRPVAKPKEPLPVAVSERAERDADSVTASGFPITELPDGTVARPLGVTQYGDLT